MLCLFCLCNFSVMLDLRVMLRCWECWLVLIVLVC